MIYANGFVSVRKLEEMINNPRLWRIVAKNNKNYSETDICTIEDLKNYIFDKSYSIGYEFIGNVDEWEAYYKKHDTPKYKTWFEWSINDLELSVKVDENGKVIAELVKWENNKSESEDMPSKFTLAYWVGGDLHFVGDKFFENVKDSELNDVMFKMKEVQKLIDFRSE